VKKEKKWKLIWTL